MSERGLGGNWLDRQAAEASMYQAKTADQDEKQTSTHASEHASEHASMEHGREEDQPVPTTAESAPPPPPAKPREVRVQFNHRILSDRDRILQQYKQDHRTTMQAIVDQMVDEYLQRRGLLPDDPQ